jgi:hypothetical protein
MSIVAIIVIIIGVLFVVSLIIGLVLASVTFLWAQSFTDEASSGIENMNIRGSISDSNDELTIEIISGSIQWSDYRVMIDGASEVTTSIVSAFAGQSVTFTGMDFQAGNQYNVRIFNILENKVVWEQEIIAM